MFYKCITIVLFCLISFLVEMGAETKGDKTKMLLMFFVVWAIGFITGFTS